MKRSWTNTITTGYEVKISRQDFLNDEKWQHYLDYCSDFYFVCPSGIILPTELPPQTGLYYVSKTGTKLFLKKKCARRDVTIPYSLLYYILICRTNIVKNSTADAIPYSKRDFWRRWLKDCKIDRTFGYQLGKKIRQTIEDKIFKVEQENARLLTENNALTEVKSLLEKWGTDIQHLRGWNMEANLKEKMLLVEQGIPQGLMGFLDDSIKNLERVKKVFQNNDV